MRSIFIGVRAGSLPCLSLAAVVLVCALQGWFVPVNGSSPTFAQPTWKEYTFRHDHVIGTSLDLWVVASSPTEAETAEKAVLDEIEHLRLVFSTYDPLSELSRLNRSTGAVIASTEILEVLRAYELWQERSNGAFNGKLGELVRVWKEAEKIGIEPTPAVLENIVRVINRSGWKIDDANRTVERLTSQPLNLNAIAKGYIIQKAAAAARTKVPSLRGLLLNLGGDMLAWGEDAAGSAGWAVGVQDPFRSEENAPPLTAFRLTNCAVATSGAYERPYRVGDKRYSHIFDPRSGRPAAGVASSTVVAPDNITANALATTLCVVPPEEGLRLVAATPNVECLLITASGKQLRSAGMKTLELARPVPLVEIAANADDKDAWPEGYQVSLNITLPMLSDGKKYRRPYVAVWVENAEGKSVRSIGVWGNSPKYLKDLSDWWKLARDDKDTVKAVTRATRGPGKYTLVWDGKDDKGKPLPQGTYTIQVEVTREYGRHVSQSGKLDCKDEPAKITLAKNAETEATIIEYGRKK